MGGPDADIEELPLDAGGVWFEVAREAADPPRPMSTVEIDDLTGVLNYREQVRMRIGSVVAVADLLHFRDMINAPFDHVVGDQVLREIGTRLREGLAPHRVYRHGGDEFAIEVEGGLDANGACRLAERIAELFGAPLPGIDVRLEVRVGVCLRPVDSGNVQDVLRMAEDAAYRAACFDLGVVVYAP